MNCIVQILFIALANSWPKIKPEEVWHDVPQMLGKISFLRLRSQLRLRGYNIPWWTALSGGKCSVLLPAGWKTYLFHRDRMWPVCFWEMAWAVLIPLASLCRKVTAPWLVPLAAHSVAQRCHGRCGWSVFPQQGMQAVPLGWCTLLALAGTCCQSSWAVGRKSALAEHPLLTVTPRHHCQDTGPCSAHRRLLWSGDPWGSCRSWLPGCLHHHSWHHSDTLLSLLVF